MPPEESDKSTEFYRLLAAAALAVLISRLPFLANGFGSDADAWRVANVARDLAAGLEYKASRLPGYPVPEYVYSLLWQAGGRAFSFNLLTAFFSTACFVLYCLFLRSFHAKDVLLTGLALVFTPAVFLHSLDSMDYIWALAFILAAFYLLTKKLDFAAGLCLGLAIGCRITSGVFLLPAYLMLRAADAQPLRQRIAAVSIPALGIGAACYLPVFQKYGFSFLSFVNIYPPLKQVVYEGSIGAFGLCGALAIFTACAVLFIRRSTHTSPSIEAARPLLLASFSVPAIYLGIFLRLPHDGAYLIPAIPFLLLLMGHYLPRRAFQSLCIALIVSSFVFNLEKSGFYLAGPVFRDYAAREQTSSIVAAVLKADAESAGKRVIVSGWFLPLIEASLDASVVRPAKYVSLLTSQQLQDYVDKGFAVYYLPEMREYNRRIHKYDLGELGAQPLPGV